MNTSLRQALKFSMVGMLNTIIGLAVIYALMLGAGVSPIISNILGYAVGLCVSFFLNSRWTFQKRVSGWAALRFLCAFALSFATNLLVLLALTGPLGVSAEYAQFPAVIVYSITFFVLSRGFVFGPKMNAISQQSLLMGLKWLGLAGVLAVVAIYLLPKVFSDADTIDFKYIWLAGELWFAGINPYTDVFAERGRIVFVGSNPPLFWVYPPNWWPVSTAVSALPYEVAGTIWRILSACCLFLGCFIVTQTLRSSQKTVQPLSWRDLSFWGLSATMSATAITLSLGQTSMLVFLGVSLFVSAFIQQNRATMTVALVILALKPTLGLVLAAALFPARFWWPAIVAAGAVTAMFTAPALIQHGIGDVVGKMLKRLTEYGQVAVNAPPEMTGLRHLADRILGVELGTFTCLGLGLIASFVIGVLVRRMAEDSSLLVTIALLLCVTAFLVPLHTYDLIFVLLVVPLALQVPLVLQILGAPIVILIWRANNFEAITGLTDPATRYFQGSLLSSVGILCLAFIALAALLGRNKRYFIS